MSPTSAWRSVGYPATCPTVWDPREGGLCGERGREVRACRCREPIAKVGACLSPYSSALSLLANHLRCPARAFATAMVSRVA